MRGFTLIELIVVISIIALLSGGGLAVFTGFRSARVALGQAQIISDTLNEAKRLAVAAEKPAECSAVTLAGYEVSFTPFAMTLTAICPGGAPPGKVRSLTSGEIIGSPTPIEFRVLTGASTERDIDICAEGHLFRINVTGAGSVTEPLEIEGGC
jgi:prepilin-type N-terminal cleavage/methylation domain-containing protein